MNNPAQNTHFELKPASDMMTLHATLNQQLSVAHNEKLAELLTVIAQTFKTVAATKARQDVDSVLDGLRQHAYIKAVEATHRVAAWASEELNAAAMPADNG